MPGPALVATDLDQTLIYSLRSAGLPPGAEAGLECVEIYEGRPQSFVTGRASRLLAELGIRALLVPTTTRTREQLARVRLPGPPPRYAIAANGGHLLVDGRSDPGWAKALTTRLAASCASLEEVRRHVAGVLTEDFTTALRTAEDLFVYAVLVRERMPDGVVPALEEWAARRGWGVSLQGRKLYFVPEALTKSAAVAEVARRAGASTVLAAGDSLLDQGLLDAADAAVRPAHGELHAVGWSPPHLDVTTATGIAAGEEILDWFLARIGSRLTIASDCPSRSPASSVEDCPA